MLGCYRESSPRLLPNAFLADDSLTAAKCAAHCTSLNYPYFGLEFGRECWCGSSPPLDSQRFSDLNGDAAKECITPCAGSPSEICGAANRVTVYGRELEMPSDVGDYVYQGCYIDSSVTGQHSLIGKVSYDPTMTLQKCRLACEEDGYPWFGVEFGTRCFCGTRLYDRDIIDDDEFYLKRAFAVSDRQCSMRCGGDSTNTTTCGDANRLSVYWNTELSLARNLREADFLLMTPPLGRLGLPRLRAGRYAVQNPARHLDDESGYDGRVVREVLQQRGVRFCWAGVPDGVLLREG